MHFHDNRMVQNRIAPTNGRSEIKHFTPPPVIFSTQSASAATTRADQTARRAARCSTSASGDWAPRGRRASACPATATGTPPAATTMRTSTRTVLAWIQTGTTKAGGFATIVR